MPITKAKAAQVLEELQSKGFALTCLDSGPGWPALNFDLGGDGADGSLALYIDDNWGGDDLRDYVYPMVNAEHFSCGAEYAIWSGATDPLLHADAPAEHLADAIIEWARDAVTWAASENRANTAEQKPLEQRAISTIAEASSDLTDME